MKCKEHHLQKLMCQWRECVRIDDEFSGTTPRTDAAVAYLECIGELESMLQGDFSPIAMWADPPRRTPND